MIGVARGVPVEDDVGGDPGRWRFGRRAEAWCSRPSIDAADVTAALTYTKLLPGSTGPQVVAYLGYTLGGWLGSAVATAAFLFPAALMMLVLAAASFVGLATCLVLMATNVIGEPLTAAVLAPCIALAVLFLAAFTAFVVLFSGFSQASAIAMKGVTMPVARGAERAPAEVA